MIAAKQAFYLFVTLLLLASSGWYFASSTPKFKIDAHILFNTTDTVINKINIRKYNLAGKLENSLETPLLRHIPKDNTHWIKNPRIVIHQENQPEWTINSAQAISVNGGDKITFNHQVRIHQASGEKGTESTFSTEELVYYPKTKMASSSQDVLFEQPGHRVIAKGMLANLEKKHVKLLGQARGTYDPNYK